MDWTLEVVQIPVSDVDRATRFYAEQVGFTLDHEIDTGTTRFVQLTPRGSGCSIVISNDATEMAPGSIKGLQLVVPDIHAARAELAARGVDISEVQVFDGGAFRPARDGDALQNVAFAFFSDPDGNGWALQHIRRDGAPGQAG